MFSLVDSSTMACHGHSTAPRVAISIFFLKIIYVFKSGLIGQLAMYFITSMDMLEPLNHVPSRHCNFVKVLRYHLGGAARWWGEPSHLANLL